MQGRSVELSGQPARFNECEQKVEKVSSKMGRKETKWDGTEDKGKRDQTNLQACVDDSKKRGKKEERKEMNPAPKTPGLYQDFQSHFSAIPHHP